MGKAKYRMKLLLQGSLFETLRQTAIRLIRKSVYHYEEDGCIASLVNWLSIYRGHGFRFDSE